MHYSQGDDGKVIGGKVVVWLRVLVRGLGHPTAPAPAALPARAHRGEAAAALPLLRSAHAAHLSPRLRHPGVGGLLRADRGLRGPRRGRRAQVFLPSGRCPQSSRSTWRNGRPRPFAPSTSTSQFIAPGRSAARRCHRQCVRAGAGGRRVPEGLGVPAQAGLSITVPGEPASRSLPASWNRSRS